MIEGSHRSPDGGATRVFRAVGLDEYRDLMKSGRFLQGPNSLEGKWFSDSIEGATAHGEAYYGGEVFFLIVADVPDDAPSLYRHPNLDGHGPARYIGIDDLDGVVPRKQEPHR